MNPTRHAAAASASETWYPSVPQEGSRAMNAA